MKYPDLPWIADVEGTRQELMSATEGVHYPANNVGGLAPRHQSALITYMIRLNAYCAAMGIYEEELIDAVKKGVDKFGDGIKHEISADDKRQYFTYEEAAMIATSKGLRVGSSKWWDEIRAQREVKRLGRR